MIFKNYNYMIVYLFVKNKIKYIAHTNDYVSRNSVWTDEISDLIKSKIIFNANIYI
jgi:hypothetical protein